MVRQTLCDGCKDHCDRLHRRGESLGSSPSTAWAVGIYCQGAGLEPLGGKWLRGNIGEREVLAKTTVWGLCEPPESDAMGQKCMVHSLGSVLPVGRCHSPLPSMAWTGPCGPYSDCRMHLSNNLQGTLRNESCCSQVRKGARRGCGERAKEGEWTWGSATGVKWEARFHGFTLYWWI